mgnify:CR=1 FL=1
MPMQKKIACPNCNKPNTWLPENPFRPFCSGRCKLIDLGEWAKETRKIPGEPVDTLFSPDGNHEQDDVF